MITTVLRYGTQVRMSSLDPYGFLGRDDHPSEADVGFVGLVIGNFVELADGDGQPLEVRQNVLGGVELPQNPEGDFAWICYKVRASDGRVLELMEHEIEVLA